MASKHIHIEDTKKAIETGALPGSFNKERTAFMFPEVVSSTVRGAPLYWRAAVRLLEDGAEVPIEEAWLSAPAHPLPPQFKAVITTTARQEDGKIRESNPTYVTVGKNLGKKNATNVIMQALRDALSLHNKHAKKANAWTGTPIKPAAEAATDVKTEMKKAAAAGEKKAAAGEKKAAAAPVAAAKAAKAAEKNLFSRLGVPGGEKLDERPPPMLVKRMGDTKDATVTDGTFREGAVLQRKYNGVRVVCYLNDDGRVIMYSRAKSLYEGNEPIRAALKPLLAKAPKDLGAICDVPPAFQALYKYGKAPIVYVDAEIYKHGESLQWISGQSRKEEDEGKLELVVYDCFFPVAIAMGHDMNGAARQRYLDALLKGAPPAIHRIENFRVNSVAELDAKCRGFVAEGYEGGILRKDAAGYKYSYNNYHSSNLLKIKPLFDSEFKVVGFTQGRKGKDVGALIWVCEVDPEHVIIPGDIRFNVTPKDMNYATRYALFKCLGEMVPSATAAGAMVDAAAGAMVTRFDRDVRGLPLTVEYPSRSTKTGKPEQAKALQFRTYEGGPANDPIAKLMADCDGLVGSVGPVGPGAAAAAKPTAAAAAKPTATAAKTTAAAAKPTATAAKTTAAKTTAAKTTAAAKPAAAAAAKPAAAKPTTATKTTASKHL